MNTELHVHHQDEVFSKTQEYNVKNKSQISTFLGIVEKIAAIAIGAFSLYTDWQLFVPFFLLGICVSTFSSIIEHDSCHKHRASSSCAHSPIEDLTGVKLPPIIATIAGVAVTICHIDHHASVFVPIVGVALGHWIGQIAGTYRVLNSFLCARGHKVI